MSLATEGFSAMIKALPILLYTTLTTCCATVATSCCLIVFPQRCLNRPLSQSGIFAAVAPSPRPSPLRGERAGVWSLDISTNILLPEGDSIIARQFTAGLRFAVAFVPKGRLNLAMSYVCSYVHCVFSTKDRRPFITAQLRERLWPYLGGIAKENGMKAVRIGGVEDHVHLLLS